jgi:hypothetical protein
VDYAVDDTYDEVVVDDYDAPVKLVTAAFDTAEHGIYLVPAVRILAITCDNAHANFEALAAAKYTRPFYPLLTADLTESEIELQFDEPIDTLMLANLNFSSFKIDIDGTQQVCAALQNKSTGRYGAIVHLETGGANILSIIITAQATLDSLAFFNLGAVTGGPRTQIHPWYSIRKNVAEKVKAKEADHKNEVVKKTGRSGHILEMVSNYRTHSQMDSLLEQVMAIRDTGAAFIYEYFSDKELSGLNANNKTFDTIWLDIWEDICPDNLVDMYPMEELAKRILNPDGKVSVWLMNGCEVMTLQNFQGAELPKNKIIKSVLAERGFA